MANRKESKTPLSKRASRSTNHKLFWKVKEKWQFYERVKYCFNSKETNRNKSCIDTYSKEIRAFLLKIWSNTTVNVTQVSEIVCTKDWDRASIYRSKWEVAVLFRGKLVILILLFRMLISLLVHNTLDNVLPGAYNTNTLLWLAFIWSLPITNHC